MRGTRKPLVPYISVAVILAWLQVPIKILTNESATYHRRGEQSAQQSRAQTGGADLLLLRLTVVRVLQQLDLVKHQGRKALIERSAKHKQRNDPRQTC